MPSVAHAPLVNGNGIGYVHKGKAAESARSGFTAVNGRASPPSPRQSKGMNGMLGDTIHVRPYSRSSPEESPERRTPKTPLPLRDDRNPPTSRVIENGHQNGALNGLLIGNQPGTPPPANRNESPESPGKRKRSSSVEDDRSYHPVDGASSQSRRRIDSYAPVERDDSYSPPNTLSQAHHTVMEHSQQRSYTSIDGAEQARAWPHRDAQETSDPKYAEPHHPDSPSMETSQDGLNTSPTLGPRAMNTGETQTSGTTEITRAGVQVDPKKRKRQFANRTKTGCGTCRRRKKKCDEAKPECNNCMRGGFICEGYAHKIPWPKNSISKGHIPLQAKDRFPGEATQLYHSHGHSREGYSDANAHPSRDGGSARPIDVEEHERQNPRNGWGAGWGEPAPASTRPESPPVPEYAHQPAMPPLIRPQSDDHHTEHPTQPPASQRQSNPRIYHHTQQTMSQVVNNSTAMTAQLALQHHSHQLPPMYPPAHSAHSGPPGLPGLSGPPGLPGPPSLPPAQPQKTEKEKMLSGEHYLLFHRQLVDEREQCKAALQRFNTSSNPALGISREERARHFRTIIEAPWARKSQQPIGYLGEDACVDTPFHCDYGYNIHIGDAVVIGPNCTILDARKVSIGTNTIIGPNVSIYTNTVSTDPRRRNGSRGTAVADEIMIGENVFIGGNVIILPGVTIGKGATIGAGCIVTKNVPPYVVFMGHPPKVTRGAWDDSDA